jgi:hypothetical protein
MKTTIDISDNILLRAKQLAHEQHQTLRSLVEEGLNKILEERSQQPLQSIHPVVFGGQGRTAEYQDASWNKIRDAAYEGHGS